MNSRLSPSAGFLRILETKECTFIAKLSQHDVSLFQVTTTGTFSFTEVGRCEVPDHTVSDMLLVPHKQSLWVLLISEAAISVIDPASFTIVHTVPNANARLCSGGYHHGLGEPLVHNGRDLYTLISNTWQVEDKPWTFVFDNAPMKVWGDFSAEYLTTLHTMAPGVAHNTPNDKKSLTILIEYRGKLLSSPTPPFLRNRRFSDE